MIDCPKCGCSFQQHDYPYICPECGEMFYGYNQLRSMSPRELSHAYQQLKEKEYFDRVYGYLETSLWQERMEVEK